MLVKGFIPPAPFKGGEGYALDTARTCCSKRLKPIKRRRFPRSPPKAERSALFLVLFLGEQKKNKPRGRGQEQLMAKEHVTSANAILIDFFQNLGGFTAGYRNGMGATAKVQKVSLGVAGNPGHKGKVG